MYYPDSTAYLDLIERNYSKKTEIKDNKHQFQQYYNKYQEIVKLCYYQLNCHSIIEKILQYFIDIRMIHLQMRHQQFDCQIDQYIVLSILMIFSRPVP